MNITDYFEDFKNSVRTRAAADETFSRSAFIQEFANRLAEVEEVDNLLDCDFEWTGARNKRIAFSGYDFENDENQLVLAVADYRASAELEKLTTTEAKRLLGSVEAFIGASLDGSLQSTLEESMEAYQVAVDLSERAAKGDLEKIRVYLLSDAQTSDSIKSFPTTKVGGVLVEFHIWDIERLHRVESSQLGREEIDIDLTEWIPEGLTALDASTKGSGVQTLLLAMPGDALAGIYELHGSRVLEANVRSFLSGKGKVNKGIRGTIQQSPELFLAYNNGITATASGITAKSKNGVQMITSIQDLQIVNGGQTTASLYYVRRNDKASLDQIFVQVKLIVVDPERTSELVPNISRFANTQNKVSESDFFSNHDFHQRMEEKSRQLLAPARAGEHFQTKWFYERTRGQYANEKNRRTLREAKRFETEYPKNQVITKPDAAKYLVSWDQKPHIVSTGAQKNFQQFATSISAAWEVSDAQFGDQYFISLVAKGMLFESLRVRVLKSSWYTSGYLANIVTYAVSKFAYEIKRRSPRSDLDFEALWRLQSVPEEILEQLEAIAEDVRDILTDDARPVINVTEWAKREACWEKVKNLDYELDDEISDWLLDGEAIAETKKQSRKAQKVDNSINEQIEVLALGQAFWVNLRDFGRKNRELSERDLGILSTAVGERGSLPTERQSHALMEIKRRMEEIGFVGR